LNISQTGYTWAPESEDTATTVYGYIRVSTDEQVTGTALDEQRRQISALTR
jgi:hypothetical protein